MLNFFHAKYLLKYSFLIMQQISFIIFLLFKLFFKMAVKTKFHASWQCVLSLFPCNVLFVLMHFRISSLCMIAASLSTSALPWHSDPILSFHDLAILVLLLSSARDQLEVERNNNRSRMSERDQE